MPTKPMSLSQSAPFITLPVVAVRLSQSVWQLCPIPRSLVKLTHIADLRFMEDGSFRQIS